MREPTPLPDTREDPETAPLLRSERLPPEPQANTVGLAVTNPDSPDHTIALFDRHTLELRRTPTADALRILTPDGRLGISITISSKGITLDIAGADLTLRTTGALAIDADELSLHGKNGVSITTDGDVSIKANDDVSLEGERVKLNC